MCQGACTPYVDVFYPAKASCLSIFATLGSPANWEMQAMFDKNHCACAGGSEGSGSTSTAPTPTISDSGSGTSEPSESRNEPSHSSTAPTMKSASTGRCVKTLQPRSSYPGSCTGGPDNEWVPCDDPLFSSEHMCHSQTFGCCKWSTSSEPSHISTTEPSESSVYPSHSSRSRSDRTETWSDELEEAR